MYTLTLVICRAQIKPIVNDSAVIVVGRRGSNAMGLSWRGVHENSFRRGAQRRGTQIV